MREKPSEAEDSESSSIDDDDEYDFGDILADEFQSCDEDSGDGDSEEEEEEMGIDLFKAAINGNTQILDDPSLTIEHLCRKSFENNNILHIAARYVRYDGCDFSEALLGKKEYAEMNMKLICERNSNGNTPFHVAAEVGDPNLTALTLMFGIYNYTKKKTKKKKKKKMERVASGGRDHDSDEQRWRPWRAKNSEGNTALHVGILNGHSSVAEFFVSRDPAMARIVNFSFETPLHLAVTYLNAEACYTKSSLLKKARFVATWRDAKGFTPLHKWAVSLASLSLHSPTEFIDFTIANEIIEVCPESTLVRDASGKSLLHLLILAEKFLDANHNNDVDKLICRSEIKALVDLQDQDGNTPLHLALKCGNERMVNLLHSRCSPNGLVPNKDGITTDAIMEQKGFFKHHEKPRIMSKDERRSADKGDIDALLVMKKNHGFEYYGSQDSKGMNFLHLLMSKTTEQLNYSFSDYCGKLLDFIYKALYYRPNLVYRADEMRNTPLHTLARNNDLCNSLADLTLGVPSPLSKILSDCAEAITRIETERAKANDSENNQDHSELQSTTTNDAENRDQKPWVMQNVEGNTPLHEAIIANNKVLVLELLSYSRESAMILNKHKETPLHLLATFGMEEFKDEEIMKLIKANSKALGLQDINGLTPMSRAVKAKNVNVVVTFLCNFQEFRTKQDDETLWQIFLQNHQTNDFLAQLLQKEAFRNMLEQKNKDVNGNTPLHIAIQDKHFGFVRHLLETCGSEHESSQDNQWLMELLKISNNLGQTSEDLLADFPSLSEELEEKLLTDHRMRGIRSSWKIPRTQLQNYMSSMNVIAALQTTITFTAAFTVPGGLNQDKGTPILIDEISFQVFMISDVIAMCLSMMVLICLLWMVATDKRKSVMIQDFALTLLLLSFVATILTFMAGIYAFIYPVKPWMAITTLVLCSLLMLFLPRRVLTNVLLHFKYPKTRLVKKMFPRPASSRLNTQQQRFAFDRIV